MSERQGSPDSNLEPRNCEVCGEIYQPYRGFQRTCRRRCYDRLPDRKAASAAFLRRPDVRERKNTARRVGTNPKQAERNLRDLLRRRYGMTPEAYAERLVIQNGKCAICGSSPDVGGVKSASRLHVDHDHLTGAIRELLCSRCNQGVGYFRDDPARLRAAAEYIERHRA